MTTPAQRHQLFISYSHKDRQWVDRLQTMIRPLVRSEELQLWDDSQIPPGGRWREEIEKALASAKVALLLVSDEFLASEFVTNRELPPLLEAAQREGLRILWVCLSPCFVEVTPINDFQAVIPPSQVLEGMSPVEQKQALKRVAQSVRDALVAPPPSVPVPEIPIAISEAGSAPAVPVTPPNTPTRASTSRANTPSGGEIAPKPALSSGGTPWPLHPIRATSCLLLREGSRWRQQRTPVEVEGYEEELAPGVELTMVRIPAGKFLMGSPQKEEGRSDDEGPQHEVSVREFFLGQTPITQAQWKVVAGWQKVELNLAPDPSKFKGPKRPVEMVSWLEAMEFCRRLCARTGKHYSLPSEAQWEYACRAGTTTPFHFGGTITAELANYRATETYGDGPKGTYREQTTEVGTFPANPWGLQDMHGNVLEWCEDHWHGNYDFAPDDDQPWLIPAAGAEESRLLRGGSWSFIPRFCRSAYRHSPRPVLYLLKVGFRVCCLAPGPSS